MNPTFSNENKTENKNQHNNPMDNKPKRKINPLTLVYGVVIAVLAFLLLFDNQGGAHRLQTDYANFQNYIKKGYALQITVNKENESAVMTIKRDFINKVLPIVPKDTLPILVSTDIPSVNHLDSFLEKAKSLGLYNGKLTYEKGGSPWSRFFYAFGPLLLFMGLIYFSTRKSSNVVGSSIFNIGKSKAKLFEKGKGIDITFKDVAGQEGAKEEVKEIVDFLKNPDRYTELGGKIPKGALLVGPPGTGKTLLAKAVAGEAHVPFFSMSGSDFVEMFVGVGASRVRDLFAQAKEKAPSIIFIDEIDAVGRSRSSKTTIGGNDERENTLNQLLTEMDGFGTNSGVIILAATNRVDVLDQALLRAGRFDRQIYVDLPDLQERIAIFKVHLRPIKVDDTLDIELMARQTPGFSGADIANVCNEAALIAARRNKKAVGKQEFLDAVDRIIGGLEKKTKVMTQAEKRTIALHEAGHAVTSWFLAYANPLVKVTIVPRGQALGAAWYMPEERTITTKEQMLDEICATLGGRAAEEVFLNSISSGALNDLERVTKRAYSMVAYLGMSNQLYNLSFYNNQEYQFNKPYSNKTEEIIDQEVQLIVNKEYQRAKDILLQQAEGHAKLTQLLIDREVIYASDMEDIFGKRPWKTRADELIDEKSTNLENHKEIEIKVNTEIDNDNNVINESSSEE